MNFESHAFGAVGHHGAVTFLEMCVSGAVISTITYLDPLEPQI